MVLLSQVIDKYSVRYNNDCDDCDNFVVITVSFFLRILFYFKPCVGFVFALVWYRTILSLVVRYSGENSSVHAPVLSLFDHLGQSGDHTVSDDPTLFSLHAGIYPVFHELQHERDCYCCQAHLRCSPFH